MEGRRLGWRELLAVVALMALTLAASRAGAAPFAFVGPRAVGMGGAGVAATEDAHAIYWNPAGLTLHDGLDIRLSGTVRAEVNPGLNEAVSQIKDALNSGDPPQVISDRIEQVLSQITANANAGTNGGGGLFVKANWGENAFGLSFYDVYNGTASLPIIDPEVLVVTGKVFNGSVVALNGLEARQIALSYARSFFEKTLSLGVTASALEGVAYIDRSFAQQGETGIQFSKNFSESRSAWDASVDAGATWNPTPWLRFAMVGKYLNRPTFDLFDVQDIQIDGTPPNLPPQVLDRIRQRLAQAEGKFQLAPQGRSSFAVFPLKGMTLTADIDVTPNSTFIKGVDSQIVSVGGEQLFFDQILATRLGVYYDFQLPGADPVPTIGLGVAYAGFSFDIAGAYDFDESAGGLAIGFGYAM